MRVTLCRSGGSEVHGGQRINQLWQSQHTLLLIGPVLELADNPSWRFLQLKRLISPPRCNVLKAWTQGQTICLMPGRCLSTRPPSCYNPLQTNCRDPQLLHLQNRRDFFSIYREKRRVFFSIYRWCICSRRRPSWSFLKRNIEQSTLCPRLVQRPRSVRWNNKFTICGNGERQQNWNLRIK